MKARPTPEPRSAAVLTKATLRAAERLTLPHKSLAKILGVSEASLSRTGRGRSIAPDGKEGELALLFVRLFRSLDSLVGGSESAAHKWLHAHNDHLGGVPAEMVERVDGLVHVVEYLDAMRGKL
jgi:Antitoxin Xre/MbcA/ParS C-terminal toxin-binding domain/Antitoxin Xre-like helix-turn-helix domain